MIVATQMLESMAKNPRPTRAEVSDVTNAVYDGADAVMLSGESAKGKYPDDTVRMMNEIILSAERYVSSDAVGSKYVMHGGDRSLFEPERTIDSAVAKAAVAASLAHETKAILVITDCGTLPPLVSAYRPDCPIVAFVSRLSVFLMFGIPPSCLCSRCCLCKNCSAPLLRWAANSFLTAESTQLSVFPM